MNATQANLELTAERTAAKTARVVVVTRGKGGVGKNVLLFIRRLGAKKRK